MTTDMSDISENDLKSDGLKSEYAYSGHAVFHILTGVLLSMFIISSA